MTVERTTRDHVVPLALWPKGAAPQHPVIVPACPQCHSSRDQDVAYFRDMLVLMCDPSDHPLVESFVGGAVERSIRRNRLFQRQVVASAQSGWRTEPSGLVTGRGVRVAFDGSRFNKSIEKIVRGIFYGKSGVPLPTTHEVKVFSGNGFWTVPAFLDLLAKMEPFSGVGDDVFQCRCIRDCVDTAATAWLIVFYRSAAFFAWTQAIQPAEAPMA